MASEIKSVYQVLEECDLEMQLDHLFFDAYHHKLYLSTELWSTHQSKCGPL